MKKRIIYSILAIVVLAGGYWLFFSQSASTSTTIEVGVKKGDFVISVNNSGEMKAKSSVSILGPDGIRMFGIWSIKINDIIAEGTVVKAGDYVATLDGSQLIDKIRERENELTKAQSQYTQTELDTTLTLREARENLLNLAYNVQEQKLVVEQSAFEPPATIKKANIELEKAIRNHEQAQKNYLVKVEQAKAKMQEVKATLTQQEQTLQMMRELTRSFTVLAPQDGMVIYYKDWNGAKVKKGSTVQAWSPVVATLPDLSKMISQTYVNEVDIRKIKVGQAVQIGVDAFPDKKLTGRVIEVANVGEQLPKTDAKVFEVVIEVIESDTTLRPSMTTSNLIITDIVKDVLYIPQDCLHTEGDSLVFVYKKNDGKIVKQQILTGLANENEIIVLEGLTETDILLLSLPTDHEKIPLIKLENSPAITRKQ